MIHEINPKKYNVEYKNIRPGQDDTVFLFENNNVCCRMDGDNIVFPKLREFAGGCVPGLVYLFSIDDERFFLPEAGSGGEIGVPDGYDMQDCGVFRTAGPRHMVFAAVTAQELYLWYMQNRYCGGCGALTEHSQTERARVCPSCGLIIYPKISPVVIVAVSNGEYLLVTRYKDRPFKHYALVAGFAEIGESLEDTVRREVFEETGVHVKNIRYYKSQPWGFTSTLLSGFFCELDGDPSIVVDDKELSEAIWLRRGDIPPAFNDIALTAEMMERFRLGG